MKVNSISGFVTSFIRKNKSNIGSPPLLTAPMRFPHGPFQFQIPLGSANEYEIQVSTDLRIWIPLTSAKAPGGTLDYVDSDASKFGFRFYRATVGGVGSRNTIGFATVTLPPGFSMIANPFHAPSNSVTALLAGMADGTTLSKFDTSLFRLTNNAVKIGKWINPGETLVPGEGAIIFNPTTDFKTLNFVGDVPHGKLSTPIPAGFSIRSSPLPQAGRLNVDLEFPLTDGDVIHIFDRDQQKYVIYPYPSKIWETNPPILGVGESFWVGKTTPGTWERSFLTG